jgi:flagellar protein FliJ
VAKYTFRFQSILAVKEMLEKKIQEEISVINQEIKRWNEQLQIIILEKNKIDKKMSEGTAKVSEYQSMKMYGSHLDQQIEQTKREIENCLKLRELKQKELVEKKKEIKAFETIKENDFQNYLIEERKSELKVLNEVALRNYTGEQS